MRERWLVMGLLAAVLLAGCGGTKTEEEPSTATAAPPTPSPLPPTWTPGPPGPLPSATPTLGDAAETTPGGAGIGGDLARGTPFPPTWTPGMPPTSTPRISPTPALATLPPAPTWTMQPDYCFALTTVGGDLTTRPGLAVTVRWTLVEEFSDYLVLLWHPDGSLIYSQTVTGGSHTLPGDLFAAAGVYSWELWPLDKDGNRACFVIGGEVIVRP